MLFVASNVTSKLQPRGPIQYNKRSYCCSSLLSLDSGGLCCSLSDFPTQIFGQCNLQESFVKCHIKKDTFFKAISRPQSFTSHNQPSNSQKLRFVPAKQQQQKEFHKPEGRGGCVEGFSCTKTLKYQKHFFNITICTYYTKKPFL